VPTGKKMQTDKNTYTLVIVGGGTAGAIAASYIKKYWGDIVKVILIYDKNKPSIGVGESLTPNIYNYLNYVGITREEMILNANATIKLGLQFSNWQGNQEKFYHPFYDHHFKSSDNMYNFFAAYDYVNDQYDNDICYGNYYFENCRIPADISANQSLHIDATLFADYILKKFKNDLSIINDTVEKVVVNQENNHIESIYLKNNGKLQADFFVDASGFEKVLFKNLNGTWIDKKNWLPLNSCIPNQVVYDHNRLPVNTIAEATDNGWILQVPLSNRWGTGYLYSSEFTSDIDAISNFQKFLKERYNTTLSDNPKILRFVSGYWKEQWIGNCICLGLASGFAEPLEATNIHQVIYQIQTFTDIFNFKIFEYDILNYNKKMQIFYDRVYLFIRYCYTGYSKDSDFWRYLHSNVPDEIKMLDEKIREDFLNTGSMDFSIFNFDNFTKIAIGLGKVNKKSYAKILSDRNVVENSRFTSTEIRKIKYSNMLNSIDHKKFIESIKGTVIG
jgi:tryptophan halogenase